MSIELIREEIKVEFLLFEESPDLFLLTEFGLTPSQAELFALEGHDLINSQCRKSLIKGGVGIFVRRDSALRDIEILSSGARLSVDKHLGTEIQLLKNGRRVMVSAVYPSQ
jgi:hypothetical protein